MFIYRRELIVNDVSRNLNRCFFIQIPSERHTKYTGTQVNTSIVIFIADKVFGFPVGRVNFGRVERSAHRCSQAECQFP